MIGLSCHVFVLMKLFVFFVIAMSDRVHDVDTIDYLFQMLTVSYLKYA